MTSIHHRSVDCWLRALSLVLWCSAQGHVASGELFPPNAGATILVGLVVENPPLVSGLLEATLVAVEAVNRNASSLFGGARLSLQQMEPPGGDPFAVNAASVALLKSNTIAILGPSTSSAAKIAVSMASPLAVPVLSFSATDPELSSRTKYPYFLRNLQADDLEMQAVAEVIRFFNWTEIVAIHVDDDFGAHGIASLEDSLLSSQASKLVARAALSPTGTTAEFVQVLREITDRTETTVFIVHIFPHMLPVIAEAAEELGLLQAGVVWVFTESVMAVLESDEILQPLFKSGAFQGAIGTRSNIPQSPALADLQYVWATLGRASAGSAYEAALTSYGLHAYDAVLLLSQAIAKGLKEGRLQPNQLTGPGPGSNWGSPTQVAQKVGNLSVPNDITRLVARSAGPALSSLIYEVGAGMEGVAGTLALDPRTGSNTNVDFEIVNLERTPTLSLVGTWTKEKGLVMSAAYSKANGPGSPVAAGEYPMVIWAGFAARQPRGWLPNRGRPLRVAVPINTFKPFIVHNPNISDAVTLNGSLSGQIIDVWNGVLKLLPYTLPYVFHPVEPSTYNELVEWVSAGLYDVAVGDISITDYRSTLVDFTQQFETAGLVVMAPLVSSKREMWAFLEPFTFEMWLALVGLFLFMALVIWWLELSKHGPFSGPKRKSAGRALWFSVTTLFFAHSPIVRTLLGRLMTAVWLFMILIVVATYQANLTSILTVQQLKPTITSIWSLLNSNQIIGMTGASWYAEFLGTLGIPQSRLRQLAPDFYLFMDDLRRGGRNGGCDAIVEELPYARQFTKNRCNITIVGQEFYTGGWGWPLPRGSRLRLDLSTAILELARNGGLFQISRQWVDQGSQCPPPGATTVDTTQTSISSFSGLFIIVLGLGFGCSLFIAVVRTIEALMGWWARRRGREVGRASEGTGGASSVSLGGSLGGSTREWLWIRAPSSRLGSWLRSKSWREDIESPGVKEPQERQRRRTGERELGGSERNAVDNSKSGRAVPRNEPESLDVEKEIEAAEKGDVFVMPPEESGRRTRPGSWESPVTEDGEGGATVKEVTEGAGAQQDGAQATAGRPAPPAQNEDAATRRRRAPGNEGRRQWRVPGDVRVVLGLRSGRLGRAETPRRTRLAQFFDHRDSVAM